MKKFRYKNILLFSSPQFCGNITEYFSQNSEKAVIYLSMPRFNNTWNSIHLYRNGKFVSEEKVWSSHNLLLYYSSWYITYLSCLLRYFSSKEEVFVISFQPYFFFGMFCQKLLRKITFVYWIGDYFPPVNTSLKLYEMVKKYYHSKILNTLYLSDRINIKMNGKVLNNQHKKTIMWGVNPQIESKKLTKTVTLCFIGVLKQSQGIELLFNAISNIENVNLKILGTGSSEDLIKYKSLIRQLHIEKKVYFPNKMFYGEELKKETANCHVGIALYDVTPFNVTYYADPGKIKTYAQFGIPILMTPIADVEKFIRQFHAGIIVEANIDSIKKGIVSIKNNYEYYLHGIQLFNQYFFYNRYYKNKFKFLEI